VQQIQTPEPASEMVSAASLKTIAPPPMTYMCNRVQILWAALRQQWLRRNTSVAFVADGGSDCVGKG
jgi:hypothetical protein